MDFVKNTGLIAWIGFGVNSIFFIGFYKKEIFSARERLQKDPQWLEQQVNTLNPKEAVKDKWLFIVGLIAFFYVVIALVTHHLTHLSVATCALTGALIAMLLGGHKMSRVLMNIDYPTIIFLRGLFIIVGAMNMWVFSKWQRPR